MVDQNGATGVATTAREQAAEVGQTAAEAGGQVAQSTKEQAGNVVGEARQQARDLVGEARRQVGSQAGAQKGRAVDGLRSLGDELHQMAQQGGQSGLATEIARRAADRAQGLADHLDRHEPVDLLDQVRSYARRRPVVFLAGAAVLGVVAGRLTRNLAPGEDSGPSELGSGTSPAALPTGRGDAAYGYEPGYTGTAATSPGSGFDALGGADPTATGTAYPPASGYAPAAEYAAAPEYPAGPEEAYRPAAGSGAEPGLGGSLTGEPGSYLDEPERRAP